jgi:hypothetical protein
MKILTAADLDTEVCCALGATVSRLGAGDACTMLGRMVGA